MRYPWILSSLGSLGLMFLVGCTPLEHRSGASSPSTGQSTTNQPQYFQVKGVLKGVELPKRQARIAHEEIPGYMPKMTMAFDVRDGSDLASLKPGDAVQFRMVVTSEDGWIDQLRKDTAAAPASTTAISNSPSSTVAPPKPVRSVEPLFPGDLVPNYAFTNQTGQATSLKQYEGQVVAFTFFFTTCPFPTMCPRMSNNLRDAYRELKADAAASTNWHLFSITIDPAVDTVQVLETYASRYEYDPHHWSFLTSDPESIETLGHQFGLNYFRDNGSLNHNLRTVVLGRDGRVKKILIGNEWKPKELVDEIRAALAQSR